jgi:hypothetical protein
MQNEELATIVAAFFLIIIYALILSFLVGKENI